MNRHFVDYNALPCAPLGEPIRKQAAKPSPETPWKPIPGHPDHVERINAQGAREVTHKDWVPPPPPPPAPAAPALDPGRVMPEAPTEWQSGPPPEKGWREVVPTHWLQPGRHCGGRYHSYFNGSTWNGDVGERADRHERGRFSSGERSDLHRGQKHYCWRGPRLTGPDWPEPQQ